MMTVTVLRIGSLHYKAHAHELHGIEEQTWSTARGNVDNCA